MQIADQMLWNLRAHVATASALQNPDKSITK
jgi:hypothetical protein